MQIQVIKQLQAEANQVGERLYQSRFRKSMTQEELARAAGTNQAVVQKIENGKSLRPRKIIELATVLEVNPAWLQFGPCAASQAMPDQPA